MKKTYHLCISSDDEVMFRDEEDYNRGFNCFALALYKTGSTGLVESFMSTHAHMLVQTEDPGGFVRAVRMPYAKYFNYKYSRSGRLGEDGYFCLEIDGLFHHIAAISYILRNGLHHGVAPIPYAYPHCSVNAIFQKEMGKQSETDLLPHKSFYRHIGRYANCPDTYKMSSSGLFLRESVLDIPQVENMFITPRNFDYYMNRRTSEDWQKEQQKDRIDIAPVTLEVMECGIKTHSLAEMLAYETGRADYKRKSDIEVCNIIDNSIIVNEFHKESIYLLTQEEKIRIANILRERFHLGKAQICRCLDLKLD